MDTEEAIKTKEQDSSESTSSNLSKNQLKKLKKRMHWQETKKERRQAEKEKKKKRLAERRERGEDVGPRRKHLKLHTMKDSTCKIRVCLDLSLEEYMADKDIVSLTSQIQHSYSANRRDPNPMQLYACSLGGRTQQRLDSIGDYKNWDIHFKAESYLDVFPKESIVYLSSESSNILTTLSEDKVYVIGGLVDHNSQKGLCHRLAEEKGVAHAQLPISEFIHLKGRKVLAVNHVFSILRRFTQTNDWKQAFLAELPTRKGFAPVFDNDNDDDDERPPTSSSDSKSDEKDMTQATNDSPCDALNKTDDVLDSECHQDNSANGCSKIKDVLILDKGEENGEKNMIQSDNGNVKENNDGVEVNESS